MMSGRGRASDRRGSRDGSGTTGLRALVAVLAAAATVACGAAGDAGETAREDGAAGTTSAASGAEPGSSSLDSLARALVPELERRSGLEARHPPRLARRSRAQLEAFLEDELAEQLPPEKAEALGATYSRLGLLPDTLQLEGLLRKLYMEQVVGYYDPEADTLFVLEDVPPSEARSPPRPQTRKMVPTKVAMPCGPTAMCRASGTMA